MAESTFGGEVKDSLGAMYFGGAITLPMLGGTALALVGVMLG
jgi:hypothetical protein